MPLYLLRYLSVDDGCVESVLVLEASDPILARRKAAALGLAAPALATVDEIDPATVPPELVGKRIPIEDWPVKKPPAPSVRLPKRRARA